MALPYVISHRKNSLHPNKESQYFLKLVQNNLVDLDHICKEIEKESTLTAPDIYAVAVALQNKIMEHLANGNSVKLDFLGKFSMGAKAKACTDKELVTAKSIVKFHINYQPSAKTKKWLKQDFVLKKK
ncbi:DNA-binding protein, histone-like, putative [Paenimyroides aquimaris]|uniref:DNA-binding protein, histone-like, putative n=1 Tax=Paenimyroides marinum TaxID=1159016 RepID=A0A1H6LRK0_9FLAO|nr:HU family DNA-binding protein [Paenimyroides aquimaris]SEH88841.1 DNA-binding protein, histone-like, putative [Paenimyroides aquimaris]